MSLSSLFTSQGQTFDSELDALFKTTNITPKPAPIPITPVPEPFQTADKKRKVIDLDVPVKSSLKRSKPAPSEVEKPHTIKSLSKGKSTTSPKKVVAEKPKAGKRKAIHAKRSEDNDGDSEDDSALENIYEKAHEDNLDSESDDDLKRPIVHESLEKSKPSTATSARAKFVPSDETPERRDQRTIFIGNLSMEVAQKRPLLKQLQRHILIRVPDAKIESSRFRSVPFQAPTSKLPGLDDEVQNSAKSKAPKQGRDHDRERAQSWRDKNVTQDEREIKNDEKNYLNPNQKKKIAFINHEFHSTADTVNAYIVFAHPLPVENRPSNVPPPPPVMDPYKAARMAAEKCDGTLFMDRAIRVDLVNNKSLSKSGSRDANSDLMDTDPKRSIFVGNLDFASKEEDLRVFFEGVVSAERGPPDVEQKGDEETGGKPSSWVTRVRIVRDKETQLGKGFAYVQFVDHQCVDEVLALEQTKLKFAKRKLRVQRCKTIAGSSSSTREITASKKSGKSATKPAPTPIVVPAGDPSLGQRLAHLPKAERKKEKAADADRVARRLAKKKARISLANKGVKPHGKDRERIRKSSSAGKSIQKKKESKGRAKSEKSKAKMKGKK